MAGKIYIESKPVASGLALGYDHAYLVYENAQGEEFVIRGGPATHFPSFGSIITEAGVPMSQSADRRSKSEAASRGRKELDLGGRDAEQVWEQMKEEAQHIQNKNYEYTLPDWDGNAHNSNTTISSILNSLGLDIGNSIPFNTGAGDLAGSGDRLPPYDNDDAYTLPIGTSNIMPGDIKGVTLPDFPSLGRGNGAGLIEALLGRGGKGKSWQQIALPTALTLGRALMQSRQKSMQDAFSNAVFGGGNSAGAFSHLPRMGIAVGSYSGPSFQGAMMNMASTLVERAVGAALSRERTHVTTGESDRSREARSSLLASRSQQAAQVAQMVQKGQKNL